jgi:serine/threonine-protein kinase
VRWSFTVLAGPEADRRHECGDQELVIIGASEQAHLRLTDDPYVSGIHCLVETRGARCLLRDLRSRNGTWINGRRVDTGELAAGDQLRVGRTPIAVAAVGAHPTSADTSCVRCGRAVEAPVSGSSQPEFVCAACWDTESESRKRTARLEAAESCARCGRAVRTANLDGRAIEFRPFASYLCDDCADDERARASRDAETVGDYDILREIGKGGFGAVSLGRHQKTGRLAAIKTALGSLLSYDERAANWFRREMAIARDLVHPNIARWYDSGADERAIYFASEYVSGGDLERRLRAAGRDALSPRVAVDFAIQTLEALEFAHERGIVHRDVKPPNLLVACESDGREVIKVSDFGLAKSFLSAGASLLTRMGETRGTPLFMAPEQFLNYRFVGPPVDVYAVGVTLYHLLTGQALFDASAARAAARDGDAAVRENGELLRMVLEDDRVPVRERRRDLPEALSAIVDIAVQRDAADRFETAAGLRTELERVAKVL